MRKGILCWIFPLFCVVLLAGNTIRISSPHFSFLITEPDGWAVDVQSAAQVAHFVVHERGKPWRQADSVIFGRFVGRAESETAEEFLAEDGERFLTQCPEARIRSRDLELNSQYTYSIKSYVCEGKSSEIVAIAPVPSYFAIFLFSSQTPEKLEASLDAFKQLLEGFTWLGRPNDPPQFQFPREKPPG